MNKRIDGSKLSILFVLFLIFFDVIFFVKGSDLRTFPTLFIYIMCIIKYRLSSKTTFLICLVFFICIYIQYIISLPMVFDTQYPLAPVGEKIAVWFYLFLIVGTIQKFFNKVK